MTTRAQATYEITHYAAPLFPGDRPIPCYRLGTTRKVWRAKYTWYRRPAFKAMAPSQRDIARQKEAYRQWLIARDSERGEG